VSSYQRISARCSSTCPETCLSGMTTTLLAKKINHYVLKCLQNTNILLLSNNISSRNKIVGANSKKKRLLASLFFCFCLRVLLNLRNFWSSGQPHSIIPYITLSLVRKNAIFLEWSHIYSYSVGDITHLLVRYGAGHTFTRFKTSRQSSSPLILDANAKHLRS